MRIKKTIIAILTSVLTLSGLVSNNLNDNYLISKTNICANAATSDGSYKNWLQYDARWGSKSVGGGGYRMARIGCAVTSLAMLAVHSGCASESDFDPGVLVDYLNGSGGLSYDGSISWGAITGMFNEFTFEMRTNFSARTQAAIVDELSYFLKYGYYILVSVKNCGHWVAIDEVKDGVVYMMDPGQNKTNILFNCYNAAGMGQIRLYKSSKPKPVVETQKTQKISAYLLQTPITNVAGDVSGNGEIDLQDTLIIAKKLVGRLKFKTEHDKVADFNNDGKVNLQDVISITKYLLDESNFMIIE